MMVIVQHAAVNQTDPDNFRTLPGVAPSNTAALNPLDRQALVVPVSVLL
jgi:hypothetical protein